MNAYELGYLTGLSKQAAAPGGAAISRMIRRFFMDQARNLAKLRGATPVGAGLKRDALRALSSGPPPALEITKPLSLKQLLGIGAVQPLAARSIAETGPAIQGTIGKSLFG